MNDHCKSERCRTTQRHLSVGAAVAGEACACDCPTCVGVTLRIHERMHELNAHRIDVLKKRVKELEEALGERNKV